MDFNQISLLPYRLLNISTITFRKTKVKAVFRLEVIFILF